MFQASAVSFLPDILYAILPIQLNRLISTGGGHACALITFACAAREPVASTMRYYCQFCGQRLVQMETHPVQSCSSRTCHCPPSVVWNSSNRRDPRSALFLCWIL